MRCRPDGPATCSVFAPLAANIYDVATRRRAAERFVAKPRTTAANTRIRVATVSARDHGYFPTSTRADPTRRCRPWPTCGPGLAAGGV